MSVSKSSMHADEFGLSASPMTEEIALCKHCQTPFVVQKHLDEFCCHGCDQVYQLLNQQGFSKFYELRGDQSLAPLRDTHLEDLEQVDWAWLEEDVKQAETKAKEKGQALASSSFALGGISCVACVWLIEALLRDSDARVQVAIYASKGSITLQWPVEDFDVVAQAKNLAKCGYMLRSSMNRGEEVLDHQDGLGIRTAICGGLAMNAMAFTLPFYHGLKMQGDLANLFVLVAAASATGSLLVGGSWFMKRAYHALRAKQMNMEVPIALGLILAYLGSIVGTMMELEGLFYFDFVATFSFLMLLGRWIQHRVVTAHQARMREFDPVPERVMCISSGKRVSREEVQLGMEFSILPGQVLPMRSYLAVDQAEFALDWINGESEPLVKYRGEVLPAGARLLGRQSVNFKAAELWKDAHVAALLEDEAEMLGNSQTKGLEKLLRGYLYTVTVIALLGFAYWLIQGRGFGPALQVMISVLIVSCPCALGLSIPIADERSTTLLKRLGVFVKRMDLFTRLPQVRTLVFDKTGTLSLEAPRVTHPERLRTLSSEGISALNRLIQSSRHPYCLGLREALAACGELQLQGVDPAVEELPGVGVQWKDENGALWFLGKGEDAGGNKVTEFRLEDRKLMEFTFEERVRSDAKETISYFKKRDYELRISSGDADSRVKKVAELLGLPQEWAFSEMSPTDKGTMIIEHDKPVLFLGDGANDILAFKAAHCRGTPVSERTPATQMTDFYWQGVGLKAIRHLFEVTKQRKLAVRGAFAFSVIYNVAVVTISLQGWMSPLLAAVVMPISSLITIGIVNGLLKAPTK